MINVASHAEIRASSRANYSAGALMGPALVVYLGCKALPLAIHAHIFRSIRRFAIRDSDSVAVWLASAHRTSIEIGSIALALSLG